MENIFVEFLPPWVETGLQPAFYDKESGTVLQQTARMYARVNMLIRMFNKLSKNTKTTVENYINQFNELHDYVHDYFDNLDVQEEINNKLDDMAESGQLADIIAQYLSLAGVLAFDTVADLKNANNIVNGSTCMCLGKLAYNDGLISYYKIRPITSGDVVDEDNIISLTISNTLIGEKVENIKFSQLQSEIDTLRGDVFDLPETMCSSSCEYSYPMKSYYSMVKIPRDFTFTIIPYSTTGYNGSYKYVNEHPNAIYINGQLESPTVINGVVTSELPPDNPEYWYILGIDNNNEVKFNKDTTRLLTGTDLRNGGYKEAFGVWSPIILNGTPFTPATELPMAESNYDYIITQKQPRSILGYDDNYWYLIVIDARLPWSQGATFDEMVSLMQTLGIANAFNMDGGSSTQLWVSNPTTNLAIRDNSAYGRGYSSANVVSLLKFEKEN